MQKTFLCLALLVPLTASAKVRDNSTRFRPANLDVANIDGYSAADWIGVDQTWDYAVNLYAGNSDGGTVGHLNSGWTGLSYPAQSMYTITGHFLNTERLDTCVVSQIYLGWMSTQVNCYQHSTFGALNEFGRTDGTTGGTMIGVLPINLPSSSIGFAVGDFDGDGFDEIFRYNRGDGSSIVVFRFDRPSGRFVESVNVALGALATFSSPGGIDILSGNVDGSDSTGQRDDLVLFNRTSHQITVYRPLVESGQKIFKHYWSQSTSLGANHQLTVANANGDAYDDLVALDTTTGVTQFLGLYRPTVFIQPLRPIQNLNQGNLPLTSGVHQMWATDTVARDTVFTVKDDVVYRYFAAVDGNGQMTYWYSSGWTLAYIWSVIKP
jgi:hypothetical protein